MKKNIIKNLIFIIIILLSYIHSSILLTPLNNSVLSAFKIIFFIFFVILFIGFIIAKISFKFSFKNKFKILNSDNFNKSDLLKSIRKSLLFLFGYFTILYIIIFYFSNYIFSLLNNSSGIINSCTYISKIFFLSLPLATFEITFLEYCNFIDSIKLPLGIIILKFLLWIILSFILFKTLSLTGFLYSKLGIDIFLLPYYIINIRKIIKILN